MAPRLSPYQMVKRLHDERRARGECINDRRDAGGPAHGPPVKSDRCQQCYDALLAVQRRSRKKGPDWVDGRTREARRAKLKGTS
jgi:hypothetical protein